MARGLRGAGLRYTLPYVIRFAGLWMVVTVAAVLAAAISSYLVFADRVGAEVAANLREALIIQSVLSIAAVLALAVFTTHRLAGPWIALRRALEDVRDGDLQSGLRLRAGDPPIHEVEHAFAEMLESLRRGRDVASGVVAAPAGSTAAERRSEPTV